MTSFTLLLLLLCWSFADAFSSLFLWKWCLRTKGVSYWKSKFFNRYYDFNPIWGDPSTHKIDINWRPRKRKIINLIVCEPTHFTSSLPGLTTDLNPLFVNSKHHKLFMYKLSFGIAPASKYPVQCLEHKNVTRSGLKKNLTFSCVARARKRF